MVDINYSVRIIIIYYNYYVYYYTYLGCHERTNGPLSIVEILTEYRLLHLCGVNGRRINSIANHCNTFLQLFSKTLKELVYR